MTADDRGGLQSLDRVTNERAAPIRVQFCQFFNPISQKF